MRKASVTLNLFFYLIMVALLIIHVPYGIAKEEMSPGLLNQWIFNIFKKPAKTSRRDLIGKEPSKIYGKCATPIMRAALTHPDWLYEENRFILYRPDNPSFLKDYSPDGQLNLTYNTPEGHFKIHYKESGKNGVYESDSIPSSIPDYVIQFGSYFEEAWDKEINMMRYVAPPPDGKNGGDNRFDVYIKNMSYYGYTQIEYGHPFIVVHNNYEGFPPTSDPEGSRAGNMKITAAHEFFHAIQYGYDDWSSLWWEENTAVWMEDEVFDLVNDYLRYLPDRLHNLDIPLNDESLSSSLYGGVIWAKFLSESYGKDIIRHIFERFLIDALRARDAIEYTLYDYNSGWGEAMSQFCLKNLTMDYEEGDLYPSIHDDIKALTQITTSSGLENGSYGSNNLEHLSCNYIKFEADTQVEDLRINLTSQGIISPITLFVADKNTSGNPIWDANNIHFWPFADMEFILNGFGTSSTYPRAYLIVINPNPYSDSCQYSWTADFTPPVLQAPVINYPVSGQIISFSQEYPPYMITLSVKNLPDDPLDPNRDLEYMFELYKNHNFNLVDSQIIQEDPNNPGGISLYQTNLSEAGDFYYWRCQARIANSSNRSYWTPLSGFFPLRIKNEVTTNVSPDPNYIIIEVTDPNSPVYGYSAKLMDPNQDIFMAHPLDAPIFTGRILPVGNWVYLGSEGDTFSNPVTITLTYTLKELDDAGITDPNGLIDPDKLGIYQYQLKDPHFYASLIKIASQHDPNNRALSGDINHPSLCVVGFSSEISQNQDLEQTIEMKLPAGWSMISLPVSPENLSVSSSFPRANVIYRYEKEIGYVRVKEDENLRIGDGYWILLDQNQNYALTGQPIPSYNKTVYKDGWDMIGGCTSSAKASVDGCSIGAIYRYVRGYGYQYILKSEPLEHGKAYWIQFKDITDKCDITVEAIGPGL